MKKKKQVRKDIVDKAIKELEYVETLNDLERKLGVKLTDKTIEAIKKKLGRRKRKAIESKRKYSAKGNRDLVEHSKDELRRLEALTKHFKEMYQGTKKGNIESIEEEKQELIKRIIKDGYWPDDTTKTVFMTSLTYPIHEDRIEAISKIMQRYVEEVNRLINLEITTQKEMTSQEQKSKTRPRYYSPWLKTKAPTKEFYAPYQEQFENIISTLSLSKTMLQHLNRLAQLESEELQFVTKPEMTTDELMDSREFIIPRNEAEKMFKLVLQKIDKGDYETFIQSNEIPEEFIKMISMIKNLPKYELEELGRIALSVIKNKRNKITKGQSIASDNQRDFLKRLENMIKDIIPVIYEEEENTSTYYDILTLLMKKDYNFDYIKELLNIDEFMRARKKLEYKEGPAHNKRRYHKSEHIILYALDQFILNYKLKLRNQKLSYVEPSYYKEIIKLFIKNKVELTPEEVAKYSTRLEEFKDYIKHKGYQTTQIVIDDINEITNLTKIPEKPKKANVQRLSKEQQQDIINYGMRRGIEQNTKRGYRNTYPSDTIKTFKIEGIEPYAFSITYNENGSRSIGIHVLDSSKIVKEDMSFREDLKNGFVKLPKMEPSEIYPTFSYRFKINNDSSMKGEQMTPTNMLIDKTFSTADLERYRDVPELKELSYFLSLIQDELLLEKGTYDIPTSELISMFLSEKISTKFKETNIPFVFQTTLPNQEAIVEENHNETCELLSSIPRNKAHQIYGILDSRSLTSTYFTATKKRESRVEINPETELGVYLLETFHDILEDRYNPNEAATETLALLESLNANHEYIPAALQSSNEREVAQTNRAYQKANHK